MCSHPRHIVRWYVLVSPAGSRNMTQGLQLELARRRRNGEPLFEYFAPMFVEAKEVNGKLVETHRPLLYNYLFVHASESEIYRMKQWLPQYNFMPRVNDGNDKYHYPYLSDESMRNLQWIARSYADPIPIYATNPSCLKIGDRIRITQGQFKGVEARIVTQPCARRKDIMVCIDDCLWVPLLKVRSGQYEVIELNAESRSCYAHLGNERLQERLHEALCRHHKGEKTAEDHSTATEAVLQYANLSVESDVMRCKLYSLLLPAYTIMEEKVKCDGLIGSIHLMLPSVKAEQSRALLLVTLYGCTDDSVCHDQAHALVDPWRAEENPKKSKLQLMQRLADYDRCLGHDLQ